MNIDLGRVTPIYRGEYGAGATYELNDIVLYTDGNLYWHVSAVPTVGVAPTDSTVWEIAFSGADLLSEMTENVQQAKASATSAQSSASGAETAKKGAEAASQAAQSSENAAKAASDAAMEILDTIHGAATEDAPAIVCEASGEVIALDDASDRLLQGLRIYGKTTQDGTPTPEAPVEMVSVGDGGSAGVTICGKNLFDGLTELGGYDVTGFKYVDSSLTRNVNPVRVAPNSRYIVSNNGAPVSMNILEYDESNKFISKITFAAGETFTTGAATRFINFFRGSSNTESIQIEPGTVITAYEPYKEAQTLPISTPNGLPGIPVTSGGNYTDADGQQYIADYRDWGRGMDVLCVGRIESYAGESIATQYMSTTGQLSAGATVLYQLLVPIETPIPADELAAYAALHTNKPNTTIYNDGGAHMDAQYVADTKLYIDKKINEIATAIVNNT